MNKLLSRICKPLLLTACGLLPLSNADAASVVDTELILLVDISTSVSPDEFTIQQSAYANAFRNSAVLDAITTGPVGSIAATLVYWAGPTSQSQTVGWTEISNSTSANAFADLIDAATRPFGGLTAAGSAIEFATPLFGIETGGADNMFESARQVINLTVDGNTNSGSDTGTASNTALAAGVDAINLFAIEIGPGADIVTSFNQSATGGTNADGTPAFVTTAFGFNDPNYDTLLQNKIIREVSFTSTVIPAPSAALAGLTGMMLIGFRRRRRTA